MKVKFEWEDFDHPRLVELRREYDLDTVVADGRDEFEKQIILKDWVFSGLKLGYNNSKSYEDAIEVLRDARRGERFNCTWYVLVMLQCAQALGWYCRKLGIDTSHNFGEEEKRHTVVDIWSNCFKKWYVIDPMFDVHFEKERVPLNAYEIRREYLENGGRKVKRIFGNYEEEKMPELMKERFDNPENYFWFFVLLRNDFLENPNVYDSHALLWVDKYNRSKTWCVGGEHKGEFRRYPMYEGAFVETGDLSLLFPDLA